MAWGEASNRPGWYITQNRRADATASLIKLRGPTWPASELEQEIEEIVHMYELERNLEGSTTFADCFRSTNARRTRITVLVALTQSWTGISFLAGSVLLPKRLFVPVRPL